MASEDERGDIGKIVHLLRDKAVTHAPFPASVLATLPAEELPALRTITVGAESCPSELANRWAVGRRLFNVYGPTETTICSTMA